jgi:hypothetical protein
VDVPPLVIRAQDLGVDDRRRSGSRSTSSEAALACLPAEAVRTLPSNPWQFFEPQGAPDR